MSLLFVYYVYIQWFIFQIKLSGLSSFTHMLCMHACYATGYGLLGPTRRIHSLKLLAGASLAADVCNGEDAADFAFPFAQE